MTQALVVVLAPEARVDLDAATLLVEWELDY